MKTVLSLLMVLTAVSSAAMAQESWRDELKKDVVNIQNDKYIIESYSLDRIELAGYESVEFQIGYYSEAPTTGFISRDNFVAFTSIITYTFLQFSLAEAFNVTASEFLAGYKSRGISQPIGRPDLEIKVYMTDQGFQIEFVDTLTEEKTRTTQAWDSLFKNDNK